MKQKITVYKVSLEGHGSYYEDSMDAVGEMLKDSDEGSKYTVVKMTVDKDWFEGLSEFTGW